MKHFKIILNSVRIVVAVLFVGIIFFMVQLYNSICEQYVDTMEQCLRRADLIEFISRLDEAGYGEEGVIPLWLGLRKSEVAAASTPEELLLADYSQGYPRMDRQLISVITRYLHDNYDDSVSGPDMDMLRDAFRRELNFSGFFPNNIIVIPENGCLEFSGNMWHIEHRVDGRLIYGAYISSLADKVLARMSGIIITTGMAALVLTFGFWYLMYIIKRQRTIEEMKDDFTNNMTHELKTPIAIAYSANEALLQFPEPENVERTRKYLTAALEQLGKLGNLVENILAVSMERRRNMELHKESVKLKPFLTEIAIQQKMRASKPCEITVHCTEDSIIEADPMHLANIVGNLVDNSLKYSGASVVIDIWADSHSIAVKDNGIGIPESALPFIFNKFYRVPAGNVQNVRGYGIGLFYVRSIVEKHGWTVSVESRPNEGTTFVIKFSDR